YEQALYRDVVVDNDGKILTLGELKSEPQLINSKIEIKRLNGTSYTNDNNFGTSGRIIIEDANAEIFPYHIRPIANGDYFIFCVKKFGISQKINIIKINTHGKVDSTFGTNGFVNHSVYDRAYSINQVIHLNDGKFLVAANVDKLNTGTNQFEQKAVLLKLNSDASIDNNFGSNGIQEIIFSEIGLPSEISDIKIDKNGQIVACGTGWYSVNGNPNAQMGKAGLA